MWPVASKEVFNVRQKRIRDLEWSAAEEILKKFAPGRFLDVGCGTGYTLAKAQELGFSVVGTEPEIGMYGVADSAPSDIEIIEAVAEDLPFADNEFDLVFSSHALEHFQDRAQGLREFGRVLKNDGTAVIVVPTGTMALVNFLSRLMFTTHIRIGKFLIKEPSRQNFKQIFLPHPHGSQAGSCLAETRDFSIKRWHELISRFFSIQEVVLPSLYPYPDFPQFFPFIKSEKYSSSVLFVCRPAT